MNYLDQLAAEIHARTESQPMEPYQWPLYRIYAVLCLAKGAAITAEDVHNAWAAFATVQWPDSPWLVPYEALPEDVQHMDDPYAAVLREMAQSQPALEPPR